MGIDYEPLPKIDYWDEVIQKPPAGKGQRELDLIFVGYGATSFKKLPYLHLDAIRHFGTATFQYFTPLEILTSNSGDDGDAVICDGNFVRTDVPCRSTWK